MLWAVKKKSWWARLDSQYGLRVHTVLINPCFISLKHHSKPHEVEKEMATHSSILAWKIPKDRRAWRATVRGVTESDTTE